MSLETRRMVLYHDNFNSLYEAIGGGSDAGFEHSLGGGLRPPHVLASDTPSIGHWGKYTGMAMVILQRPQG